MPLHLHSQIQAGTADRGDDGRGRWRPPGPPLWRRRCSQAHAPAGCGCGTIWTAAQAPHPPRRRRLERPGTPGCPPPRSESRRPLPRPAQQVARLRSCRRRSTSPRLCPDQSKPGPRLAVVAGTRTETDRFSMITSGAKYTGRLSGIQERRFHHESAHENITNLTIGPGYYANPLTWGRLGVTTRNSRRKS